MENKKQAFVSQSKWHFQNQVNRNMQILWWVVQEMWTMVIVKLHLLTVAQQPMSLQRSLKDYKDQGNHLNSTYSFLLFKMIYSFLCFKWSTPSFKWLAGNTASNENPIMLFHNFWLEWVQLWAQKDINLKREEKR